MCSTPTPDARAPQPGLQRLLQRFVDHVITTSSRDSAEAISPASQSDVILSLLARSQLLGERATYMRLLERFATFLERQIPLDQFDQLLEAALSYSETSSRAAFLSLTSMRIRLLTQAGDTRQAQALLDMSWAAAERFPEFMCELYIRQGVLSVRCGDYNQGQQAYERGLALAQQLDDAARTSIIHNNLGNMLYDLDRYDDALSHYHRALDAASKTYDPIHRTRAEGGKAVTLDELGRYREAEHHHERARLAAEENNDLFSLLSILLNLSYHSLLQEKYAEALEDASRALIMARQLNDWDREAFALHNLGQACLGSGSYQDALDFLSQALERRIILGQAIYIQTTAQIIEQLAEAVQHDSELDELTKERILHSCNESLGIARSALSQA